MRKSILTKMLLLEFKFGRILIQIRLFCPDSDPQPWCQYLTVSVSVSPSICPWLSVHVSLSLFLCPCLSAVSLSLSLCPCLSILVSLSLSLCPCHSVVVSLSLSLCTSLSVPVPLSLSLCPCLSALCGVMRDDDYVALSMSLPVIPTCLSFCIFVPVCVCHVDFDSVFYVPLYLSPFPCLPVPVSLSLYVPMFVPVCPCPSQVYISLSLLSVS